MTRLRRDDGFGGRGDEFYELLVRGYEGLDEAASGALNARLVVLLANHVGDLDVVAEALTAARNSLAAAPAGTHKEH